MLKEQIQAQTGQAGTSLCQKVPGSAGSVAGCSEHPIALPCPLQHPQNHCKPCTEMLSKPMALIKTLWDPVRAPEWAPRGYLTGDTGGFNGLGEPWQCGAMGWDRGMGQGRKERTRDGHQPLQTLRPPSLSFSTTDRRLENIKSSKMSQERGR